MDQLQADQEQFLEFTVPALQIISAICLNRDLEHTQAFLRLLHPFINFTYLTKTLKAMSDDPTLIDRFIIKSYRKFKDLNEYLSVSEWFPRTHSVQEINVCEEIPTEFDCVMIESQHVEVVEIPNFNSANIIYHNIEENIDKRQGDSQHETVFNSVSSNAQSHPQDIFLNKPSKILDFVQVDYYLHHLKFNDINLNCKDIYYQQINDLFYSKSTVYYHPTDAAMVECGFMLCDKCLLYHLRNFDHAFNNLKLLYARQSSHERNIVHNDWKSESRNLIQQPKMESQLKILAMVLDPTIIGWLPIVSHGS